MKYLHYPLLGQRTVTTNLCGSCMLRRNVSEQMFPHTWKPNKKSRQLRLQGTLPWGRWRYIWVSGALSHGPFQSTQQTYHLGKPGKRPWKLLHFLLQEKGCTIQKQLLGRYFGKSLKILIGSTMETNKTKEMYQFLSNAKRDSPNRRT